MNALRVPWLIAFALSTGIAPVPLHPQSDSTAVVRGTAKSAFNGRSLSGVMIAVPAVRRFTVTDSTGAFELRDLPPGRQRIRIAYEGRQTEEYEFLLRPGKAKKLAVVLDVEAVDLAPVVVEAQHRDWWRDLAGFYERRQRYGGFAHFYTREDLVRLRAVTLSQVLARDGIFTHCRAGGCLPMRWSRGRLCPVAVSVDGSPFWELDYEGIAIADVQGVEVYRTTFMAPAAWGLTVAPTAASGVATPIGGCGSVQIWTR
jgi:hypothetical protein